MELRYFLHSEWKKRAISHIQCYGRAPHKRSIHSKKGVDAQSCSCNNDLWGALDSILRRTEKLPQGQSCASSCQEQALDLKSSIGPQSEAPLEMSSI